ncbi:MAG TPA: hypothetical protein VJ925_06250 [Longimicrobiales bacterium]|nr:hypothetical protein [Longimicrobiales bacterium]
MKARHSRWTAGLLSAALVMALSAQVASAQTTMPSTLRFGSGYLDVPSASVLPHLAIQGTYSGWFANETPNQLEINPTSGAVAGFGPQDQEDYYQDIALAIGLFNRLEIGATLQQTNDEANGGTMFGYFGRLAVLKPAATGGLGLAAGVRYMDAPDYPQGLDYQPNRLGFADFTVRGDYDGSIDNFDSELTVYGVGTINVPGPQVSFLPDNDVTFSLGYGNGLFKEGGEFDWYTNTDSDGWFSGASWALGLTDNTLLHLVGEWNGFDMNTGVQLDVKGVRVGAHVLGLNHGSNVSIFRSRKVGFLVSTNVCPGGGLLCGNQLLDRIAPDTVQLPAPAPDTVVVTREVEPALPTGSPANICLATGQNVQVLMTAQGDTLVGPARVSIETLRPGVVFAGTYADSRGWFENDESVMFEENSYDKSGNETQMTCNQIMRVGEFQGVPLFSMRNAERPFEMLYVPVRPGIWQPYETGLQGTRGDF